MSHELGLSRLVSVCHQQMADNVTVWIAWRESVVRRHIYLRMRSVVSGGYRI